MCCLESLETISDTSKVHLFIHTFMNECMYLFKVSFVLWQVFINLIYNTNGC